jgi:hypothetical protein
VQPLLSPFHHHHLRPRCTTVYHISSICFLPCVPSKKHTTILTNINLLIIHTEPLDKFLGMVHVFRQLIRIQNDIPNSFQKLIVAVVGEELELNSHEPSHKSMVTFVYSCNGSSKAFMSLKNSSTSSVGGSSVSRSNSGHIASSISSIMTPTRSFTNSSAATAVYFSPWNTHIS